MATAEFPVSAHATLPEQARAAVGLTGEEAAARLAREGFNELPASERRSPLRIVAEVMREPMFALLVGAALLYAAIGDLGEALVLLAFATISVSITVIQQGRSERVLDALRDLTSPRALVVRDGQRRRIPGREVVRGDTLVLAEGDRVPADGVLVAGANVYADESLLTGESVPVSKRPAAGAVAPTGAPGGDDLPGVYSGSLIVRGSGLAIVTATGARSEIGKIGGAVAVIDSEPPRLQAETRRLVLVFATIGMTLSALAVLLYGLLRGSWLDALLAGIALGMSMLPEEFPLVLTVFMVMGAWRLSQSRVLTRRAAAIETLGAATVLCTDKTGTLTRNHMSVARLIGGAESWAHGESLARITESPALAEALQTAILASDREALDPMEQALTTLADEASVSAAHAAALLHEYPLSPDLLAVTRVWSERGGDGRTIAAKGAPEAIAALCGMSAAHTDALRATVHALAREGMRVLGIARGRLEAAELPASPADIDFTFLGLVGFADPLRDTVPEAVRECRSAGIRVVMITGDHPETARAIARQAGIGAHDLLSGAELARLDDDALAARARTTTVFARITPQQKLRIVNALKTAGEVVAMTGDGVNDAPALKAAHIGIAMGGRGTDVAREASSLVLLDDDFGSIVRAVRLGRRISDNLRKAMGYILAIHVPIAGLALLPILLGWPLVLTPMLIAFLELIIDPACSVVLEAEREERDVMGRPPRDPQAPLLSSVLVGWSLAQGVLALALVATVYVGAVRAGMPEDEVRALAFATLVGVNIALIFANRTFSASLRSAFGRPNASLWWGLGIASIALLLIFSWPAGRGFFGLGVLHGHDVGISFAAALGLLVVLELGKSAWRKRLAA